MKSEEKNNIVKENDFVEMQFTGKVKGGEVFDSNIEEDLKKAKLDINLKPFVICVGQRMFLEAIDNFLIGKEIGGEYEIELSPEKAFGKRDGSLIKLIPTKIFLEKNLQPRPGMVLDMDGVIAKIISVSGGRTITDFNNLLAGKTVIYKIKLVRKIINIEEKIRALMNFFIKKEMNFKVEDKKLIVSPEKSEKQIADFLKIFKEKFKEVLDLELVIKKTEESDNKK